MKRSKTSLKLYIRKTTNTLDINTFLLSIALVKYILNVPLEYSPDIISDGMIVDKKGI